MAATIMNSAQPPRGFKPRCTLRNNASMVRHVAWSFDGSKIAAAYIDGTLRVWDSLSGRSLGRFVLKGREFRDHRDRAAGLAFVSWSRDGRIVVAGSTNGFLVAWDLNKNSYELINSRVDTLSSSYFSGRRINSDVWIKSIAISPQGDLVAAGSEDRKVRIWDTSTLELTAALGGSGGDVIGLRWSPDGTVLFSGAADGTVLSWSRGGAVRDDLVRGHSAAIEDMVWSPDGATLATASWDHTVRIWDFASLSCEAVLEAHTSRVLSLSFSFDGSLLGSMSENGMLQMWRCKGWEPLRPMYFGSGIRSRSHALSFHPSLPVLATLAMNHANVQIWDLDMDILRGGGGAETVHYTNAKVVLLGETSTGKTCLARALMQENFEPQESTHGMTVWNFELETVDREDGGKITRETLLWDLAGQVDYQVVHQLFLDETVLGVVVFDPTHPENPFGGVGYWEKALTRVAGKDCPRLLVAGRIDRGHPTATAQDIEAFRQRYGYEAFIATSSKTGSGIASLRDAIKRAIPWSRLPVTSSPKLWRKIREYLILQKVGSEVLTRRVDLRKAFTSVNGEAEFTEAEFDTVIGHAQAQGLVWRLSFGDFVLLRPELLNNYAAAIVRAARRHPHGLGCVAEQDALDAKIDFEDLERLSDLVTERALLHAVVQLFLQRELALREMGQISFPSKFNRQRPPIPEPQPREVAYRFAGSIEEIYATLVVRLFYCGAFSLDDIWKNAAEFRDSLDCKCGFSLDESSEGEGALSVFFGKDTPDGTKVLFLRFIHEHLNQRSVDGSVVRMRIYRCSTCGEEVQDRRAIELRLNQGKTSITCQFCDEKIEILDILESKFTNPELLQQIRAMEAEVAERRSEAVGVTVAEAKESVGEYDVFLAHNSLDKGFAESIGQALKRRGLNPWLDKEQIPPGHWFQDVIQQAINCVKSAAILIGPSGLGPWQVVELRSFISQCVERKIPVIPVLLPGVKSIPREVLFLREFRWVKFNASIEEPDALDNIQWGITGQQVDLSK